MPALGIATLLRVSPGTIRTWRHRGLIGPVCDVETRDEGYDVAAVRDVSNQLKSTRPRNSRR